MQFHELACSSFISLSSSQEFRSACFNPQQSLLSVCRNVGQTSDRKMCGKLAEFIDGSVFIQMNLKIRVNVCRHLMFYDNYQVGPGMLSCFAMQYLTNYVCFLTVFNIKSTCLKMDVQCRVGDSGLQPQPR